MEKPGLMLAVMDGLKKKGKLSSAMAPKPEMEEDSEDSSRKHLLEVSSDLIDAIHAKDHDAVADLLEEAFMCLDTQPHEEGPDSESDKDSKY